MHVWHAGVLLHAVSIVREVQLFGLLTALQYICILIYMYVRILISNVEIMERHSADIDNIQGKDNGSRNWHHRLSESDTE